MRIVTILKVVNSLAFLTLLVNHITKFTPKYIQFGTSPFISNNHLQYSYYFFIVVEIIGVCMFFIWQYAWIRLIFLALSMLYFCFLIFLLFYIENVSGNCVNCHYFAQFLYEDSRQTLLVMTVLFVLNLFLYFKYDTINFNQKFLSLNKKDM